MLSLRVHAITFNSRSNGPGRRHVLHLQGCTLACPGCFNPQTHPAEGGQVWEVEPLALHLLSRPGEGLTISGGEPFQQLPALRALLTRLRGLSPELSVLVFSGYTRAEIEALPQGGETLALLDVLVDGRFDARALATEGLRGSENQVVHLLSARHSPEELAGREVEIVIRPGGEVVVTGFPEMRLVRGLRRRDQ